MCLDTDVESTVQNSEALVLTSSNGPEAYVVSPAMVSTLLSKGIDRSLGGSDMEPAVTISGPSSQVTSLYSLCGMCQRVFNAML